MRMIERWFPCAEVSNATTSGWGSGNQEAALFTWFAKRPLAQAKAAVITSLLPWPDDAGEQRRLQDLVRRALTGRDTAATELRDELRKHFPDGCSLLDIFSGRAMIPLEAGRLGVSAEGIDYSPVATLGGQLLADFPMRDWSSEPPLPFASGEPSMLGGRLLDDVRDFLLEVGRRHDAEMADVYPVVDGRQPWGYIWAVTLPCQECGNRFPLTGSLALRHPQPAKNDAGQSYRIDAHRTSGTFTVAVHDGPPQQQATLLATTKGGATVRGKAAVCPSCAHVHPKAVHGRLAAEGLGRDALLVAADLDETVSKRFRVPTEAEHAAVDEAEAILAAEPDFLLGMPARPNERIPAGNNHTIRPSLYGARSYGDLCVARQTLGFVRLARAIATLGGELRSQHGISEDYAAALAGYAGAVMVRKLRRSTWGATLQVYSDFRATGVKDI